MPKREDIKRILVIGSGPIVIGQACEFDYSGAQACKVLKEDGYEVVLVNSNPATIMTDPQLVDRTYVEPITKDFIEKIIEKERPDALLPTLGGQTALNAAVELAKAGILEKYGVEMIGCDLAAIERGEDRKQFNEAMAEIGLEVARSGYAYSLEDALFLADSLGYPLVIRPSFTLGGAGGGIAHNQEELELIVSQGLDLSPVSEVLVEESIEGWKEYEMEVMRDKAGNGIIICSIENFDPMGVHTGDSITVAPAQTLSDVEYQRMRVASLAILEKIGVETGGSNVQFAINPQNGRLIVIEMNPRVSRSSALASKATGFPIAKAAAKLAVGYTLDEITNDITKATPACFEPSIDYCVVKVPRFAFEKFKGTDTTLSTRMKAVGEIMAIGRTFEEAFGKAMRSLENGRAGLGSDGKDSFDEEHFEELVGKPTEDRMFYIAEAFRRNWTIDQVFNASKIDRWFLSRLYDIIQVEKALGTYSLDELDAQDLLRAKQFGLSDIQIAYLTGSDEHTVRARRKELGVVPVFKTVALRQKQRVSGGQNRQQAASQLFTVQNLIPDGAGIGQMTGDLLILELRPEHTRGIQKLNPVRRNEPPVFPGDARPVLHLGLAAPGQPVDKGGFPHIGNPQHHHPDRAASHSFAFPDGQLIRQQFPEQGGKPLHAPAGFAVRPHGGSARCPEESAPRACGRLVRQIRLIQHDQPGFFPHQPVQLGVPGADGNTGIDNLHGGVHQPQALFDFSPRPGHVARKPLNGAAFLHVANLAYS